MDQNSNKIQEYTVLEFQENFEQIISKVEHGKSFKILSEYGTVMLVPYLNEVKISDDVEYLCNHDDAS
jgi:hypothetical protein